MRRRQRVLAAAAAVLILALIAFFFMGRGARAQEAIARSTVSSIYSLLQMGAAPPIPSVESMKERDPLAPLAEAAAVEQLRTLEREHGRVMDFRIARVESGAGRSWTATIEANRNTARTVERAVSSNGATVERVELLQTAEKQ